MVALPGKLADLSIRQLACLPKSRSLCGLILLFYGLLPMNSLTAESCVTPDWPKKFPGNGICSNGHGPAPTFGRFSERINALEAFVTATGDSGLVSINTPLTSASPAIAVTACTVQCASERHCIIWRLNLVISFTSPPNIAASIIVPTNGIRAAVIRLWSSGVRTQSAKRASNWTPREHEFSKLNDAEVKALEEAYAEIFQGA